MKALENKRVVVQIDQVGEVLSLRLLPTGVFISFEEPQSKP